MDELEKTAQETAEETGGMAPDAGEQQVPAGEQGVPGGEEDFETLIRGRYKGEFDARVRRILDGRLRGLRQENERLREMAAAAETARQREQEEMKTIFRNRSDPTAYSSAPGHTGKIRRPKIKGLSVIPSTRTFSRINPKSATSDSVSRLRTVCRPERKGDNAQ